jgi:hypothetical protein
MIISVGQLNVVDLNVDSFSLLDLHMSLGNPSIAAVATDTDGIATDASPFIDKHPGTWKASYGYTCESRW